MYFESPCSRIQQAGSAVVVALSRFYCILLYRFYCIAILCGCNTGIHISHKNELGSATLGLPGMWMVRKGDNAEVDNKFNDKPF